MLDGVSDSELALVLDALDVGIVILGRDGRVVVWNDWAARYTHTTSEAMVGQKLVDVFPTLEATRLPSSIQGSFENGSSSILTHGLNKLFPLRDETGKGLLHNVIVRPLYSGSTQQCLLQINDVTIAVTRERLLRERHNARYQAIADTAPDAIITVDAELTIQWLNATAIDLLGYSPEELIGQAINCILENKNDLTASFLELAYDRNLRGSALQLMGRRKDGSLVPFEMSLARWKVDDHVFMTTIWRDVTDRVLAEKALRRSEAQLRRTNEELEARVTERTREREAALAQLYEAQKMETIGQLTGGVAHDFNNLLSVILGSLSLLRKRLPDDPRITRLLDGAVQGAERGATLTKRLLAFARRQELELEAIELQSLIPEMMDFLRQSVGPNVQLTVDIAEDVWPIMIDANQFELAVMNLAVNARDAMPKGGAIAIAARNAARDPGKLPPHLSPGEYVRLTIADTGEGMDETTRARSMEPFFTTKGVGKGTGLGLSMVHGLTAQSGGAMDIASEPGKGTVVTLWLPRAVGDVPVRAPAQVVEVAGHIKAQSLRILLVDDDVLVNMNTANMLADLGHEVVEAHSGVHALSLVGTEGAFDVMITDYAMPGMNGLELAAHVQSKYPGIRVILATGYAELPTDTPVGYPRLAKPYAQEQLSAVLEQRTVD